MKLSKKECEDRFFFILGLIRKGYDNEYIKMRVFEYEKHILEHRKSEKRFMFALNFQRLQYKAFKASESFAKYYRNYRFSKSFSLKRG